jgi:hypothetical protein
MVLVSECTDLPQASLPQLAAPLFAVRSSTAGTLADRMSDRFPLMHALSPANQDSYAKAVLTATRASFATHQPHLAIAELTAWRETATAITACLGNGPVEQLTDQKETVERP